MPSESVIALSTPPTIIMELARNSPHDALIAYLKEHHTLLVELLPSDTNCANLFGQVECGRTIDSFFDHSDDRAVSRALARLTQRRFRCRGW